MIQFLHNIIAKLLDTKDISLRYEDLVDAKTRLKELFDAFGDDIGKLKYTSDKVDRIHYVKVWRNDVLLSEGSAPLKADAQQKAAEKAIKKLNRQGFTKLSENYEKFCS
jgi:dsRNA-specific ribonuclease